MPPSVITQHAQFPHTATQTIGPNCHQEHGGQNVSEEPGTLTNVALAPTENGETREMGTCLEHGEETEKGANTSTPFPCFLDTLPDEIVCTIIRHMGKRERFRLSLVSRRLRRLCASPLSGPLHVPVHVRGSAFRLFLEAGVGTWGWAITDLTVHCHEACVTDLSTALQSLAKKCPRIQRIYFAALQSPPYLEMAMQFVQSQRQLAHVTYDYRGCLVQSKPGFTPSGGPEGTLPTSIEIRSADGVRLLGRGSRVGSLTRVKLGPVDMARGPAYGLEWLRTATNLRHIEISGAVNVNALGACRNLESAVIHFQKFGLFMSEKDVSALGACRKLTKLEIMSPAYIPPLPKLKQLTVVGNIGSVESLAECYSLTRVEFVQTTAPDLASLAWACANHLKELKLSSVRNFDSGEMVYFEECRSLTRLVISDMSMGSIGPRGCLAQLEDIEISACFYLSNISALHGAEGLTSLTLECGYVDHRADIRKFPKLRELRSVTLAGFSPTEVKRLLGNSRKVANLGLEEMEIKSIDDLGADLSGIKRLKLRKCRNLKDISHLRGCQRLVGLHLESLPSLSGIEPISACGALHEISMVECGKIRDVSPLCFPSLSKISFRNMFSLPNLDVLSTCRHLRTFSMANSGPGEQAAAVKMCPKMFLFDLK